MRPTAMDALRAALAHLRSTGDDDADARRRDRCRAGVRRRVGRASARAQRRSRPIRRLGHAADYLRMTTGARAVADAARALDAYLVTVIDHGMNASTFTARVITSTASDLDLRGRRRGRRAQGPAARRRAGAGARHARRDRRARARRGVAARRARGRPPHHGHGPPHLSRARSARGGARDRGQAARVAAPRRSRAPSRRAAAKILAERKPGSSARGERRVLHGRAARRGRPAARAVRADVRGRPRRRLVRARDRAAPRRPARAPGVALRRPDA